MTSIHLPTLSSDPSDFNQHHEALRALVRGEVRFGWHDRMLYATDASLYQVEPLGVVIPADVKDVERVVRYAGAHRLPLLPRGSGTSLAGQAVNRALILDTSVHLRKLLALNQEKRTVRVEPGIVLDELNEALAIRTQRTLWFGPDVATARHANLGGMIGNNSAGIHSILYGRTVEHLRGVRVLLTDGNMLDLSEGAADHDEHVADLTRQVVEVVRRVGSQVRARYPKTARRVNGYNLDLILDQIERSSPGTLDRVNLASLICGSEGTLGVVTEATLNLVDRPQLSGLAVIAFETLDDAVASVRALLETKPSAIELLDDLIIELAKQSREHRRAVDLLPQFAGGRVGEVGAVLYVEHFADDVAALREKLERVRNVLSNHPVALHTDPASVARAWALRKAGEPLLHAVPGSRKPLSFVEDTAVDPLRLPEFVRDFRRIVARHGTRAAFYAHASVGCLHIRPMLDLRNAKDQRALKIIAEEVTDLVRQYDGALSGEHGDGRARGWLLERFYGPEIVQAFRDIKQIFDPNHLMNPGNIVEPQAIDENLRVTACDQKQSGVDEATTFFDFGSSGGLQHAAEQCNGAGVCRKKTGGTMCPSYMATLDERHSTRGRGNALRLAVTGQFNGRGLGQWNDPETLATLDWCLSCKACKTECPSNVDIAQLKAEYLAQGFRETGHIPLATRMFGHVRVLNRLGSAFAPFSNEVLGNDAVRRFLARWLGMSPRRSLPTFAPSLFSQWPDSLGLQECDENAPIVLLFGDCFTAYNEPSIGLATARVFNRLGYRVMAVDAGCCGRSMISLGLLPDAARTIERTIARLKIEWLRTNAQAIIVCEPGCLSAMRDEWQSLKTCASVDDLKRLTSLCMSPEEFIERRWNNHPHHPKLNRANRQNDVEVIVHAHCHQKALWSADETVAVLNRFVGDSIRLLDAGCCGMAGTFGYMADHDDLSMAIGNQRLFPEVNALLDDAEVVATGTSCRHQIADGTRRRALHPMELVDRALAALEKDV